MPKFFKSSWGSVELWIAKITTNVGRKLVVQQYTRGNVPDAQDKGDVPNYARCQLLFDDLVNAKEDGAQRLLSLITLKGLGKPQLFTHPLVGTYLAMIEDFDYEIEESGTISGSATFLAVEETGAVVVDPLGASLDIDTDALSAATDNLTTELANVGITSTIPDVAATAAGIFDQANSARDVLVGLSDISERIGQEIDDLQLAADTALWPAFKAYVLLGEASRAAAVASTGDVGDLMTLRVDSDISLRRLMSEIYGASDAEARGQEALQLNDISKPARITKGTQLKLRQPKRAA